MIYQSEKDFVKDIKDKNFYKLYLLYGAESYLIDLYAQKLSDIFVKENSGFNSTNFDGEKVSLKEISDLAESLPFFSEKRVVIINEPSKEILGDKDLESFLSDIPDFTIIIFKIKSDSFNPEKTASHKKLLNFCGKYGGAISLGERKETDLIKYVITTVKRAETSIEKRQAQDIIAMCGNDMNKISYELAKLTAYANKEPITDEMIEKTIIPTVEAQLYELTNSINYGNMKKALEILHKLFILREEPLKILGTLYSFYVNIYKAKISQDKGVKRDESSELFGFRAGDFRIKRAYEDCGRYTEAQLIRIISVLAEADLGAKSSSVFGEIIIEKAVVEIMTMRKY